MATKRALRKGGVSALIAVAGLVIAMDQAATGFQITSMYRDEGRTHLIYESDPDGYFIALSMPAITGSASVAGLELGQAGSGTLAESDPTQGGFYWIEQVPLDQPYDLDTDGMDDVFELKHTFLDPLEREDAYRDQDKDGISNLGEYRLGTDPDDPTSGPAEVVRIDSDDDGYPDAYETVHGSDLADPTSQPAPTRVVEPGDSIQMALDAALPFDIIALADGVYAGAGNRRFPGPLTPVLLTSRNGPDHCILDMELDPNRRGFVFNAGQTGQSVLRAITLRRAARGPGAGVEIAHNSSPTLWGCIIEDCVTDDRGAGIRVTGGSEPAIVRCLVRNNIAGEYGAGIYITGNAAPVIRGCEISGNQAGDDGGGIGCRNGAAPWIVDCIIEGNLTDGDGGAIGSNFDAHPQVESCLLRANQAIGRGGAVFSGNQAIADLRNCTVIENEATALGGALYHFSTSPVTVANSILYGNLPNQVTGNGAADVQYSCVEGATLHPGVGNINQDPLLAPNTFRLGNDSPCIDAGLELTSPRHDWDGEIRFDHPGFPNPAGFTDMGADEFMDDDQDGLADAWVSAVGLPAEPPDETADPEDLTPPTLLGVPADMAVGCDQLPLSPVVTANDAKDGPVPVIFEEVVPVAACPYDVFRIWTATDAGGNSMVATQRITVTTAIPGTLPIDTGFEAAEGFAPGDLAGQVDWISSTSGVTIQTQSVMSGTQAVSMDSPGADAARPVASSAAEVDVEFSLYLQGAAHGPESPTAFPAIASAVLSHDPGRGLVALDGDGTGGGIWRVVPGTQGQEGVWVSLHIVKQDAAATWSVSVNGGPPLPGLGYKDAAATGIHGVRFRSGQSGQLTIDEVKIR